MNATRLFNREDTRRIEQAIADAESRTAAEFVCAVATESGRYDRAEAIVGLVGAIIGLALADLLHNAITSQPGEWSTATLAFGWQALAVTGGFVAGHLLASSWRGLRRLFVAEKEADAEVSQAAWHVFAAASVRGTVGRSGLLIYVSLAERRVVVLADEAACNALGDERIAALRDRAVEQLRSRRFVDAFVTTVAAAAGTLAESLPADRRVNPNELDDHLLAFHPRPAI